MSLTHEKHSEYFSRIINCACAEDTHKNTNAFVSLIWCVFVVVGSGSNEL